MACSDFRLLFTSDLSIHPRASSVKLKATVVIVYLLPSSRVCQSSVRVSGSIAAQFISIPNLIPAHDIIKAQSHHQSETIPYPVGTTAVPLGEGTITLIVPVGIGSGTAVVPVPVGSGPVAVPVAVPLGP